MQPCTSCTNDTQSYSGSCAEACPSGALSLANLGAGSTPEEFVYLSFYAREISPVNATRVDIGQFYGEEVKKWLVAEGVSQGQAQEVVTAMGPNEEVGTRPIHNDMYCKYVL